MLQIPMEKLKETILEKSDLDEDKLEDKIKKKMEELSGLISEEGAAHIIANELGINILKEAPKLKIKDLDVGMRNVEVTGKVMQKFELREFETGTRKGKVASFIMGDETGRIRVTMWNKMAEEIEKLKDDDVLKIKSGYVRENNNFRELHLNDKSDLLINPKGVEVGKVQERAKAERKKIKELKEEDERVEVLGTIVQVFDPRFFAVCPKCNKRVQENEEGFVCQKHKKVEPKFSYVLNLILDDGTETIRTVFWKRQIENLLNKKEEEVLKYKDNLEDFEDEKTNLLGNIIKVIGKAKKNDMFDRLELSVNLVYEGDPEDEIAKLEEE